MPNPGQYTYTNIATNTTTQVFSGRGVLHSIVINTAAAGSIILVDNTSGTTPPVGIIKASAAEGTYLYDVTISKGLRIVTAGATDITVAWSQ